MIATTNCNRKVEKMYFMLKLVISKVQKNFVSISIKWKQTRLELFEYPYIDTSIPCLTERRASTVRVALEISAKKTINISTRK